MATNSKIEWCFHTFNPWRGCQKVSDGCKNCYADALSNRNPAVLGVWGPPGIGTRVKASESQWTEPKKWNEWARRGACHVCGGRKTVRVKGQTRTCEHCDGRGTENVDGSPYRARVFCASLADVFEDWPGPVSGPDGRILVRQHDSENVPESWFLEYPETADNDPQGWHKVTLSDVRARLFSLIDSLPYLDFLLVTKRPENIERFWPTNDTIETDDAGDVLHGFQFPVVGGVPSTVYYRPNVWLLTSVENQAVAAKRIKDLTDCRIYVPVLGLSMEPLLGPVSVRQWLPEVATVRHVSPDYANDTGIGVGDAVRYLPEGGGLHWLIVGGESGGGARTLQVEWIRNIVNDAKRAGVPCFVKQLGEQVQCSVNDVFPETNVVGRRIALTPVGGTAEQVYDAPCHVSNLTGKGGDIDEWPLDIRVREFPQPFNGRKFVRTHTEENRAKIIPPVDGQ